MRARNRLPVWIAIALSIGYATPVIAQSVLGAPASTEFKFSTPMPSDVAPPDKVESRSGAPTPPKIHELLTLLADPKVKEWLEGQAEAKTAAGSAQQTDISAAGYLNSRAGAIHDQIVALARAFPDLPNQFARAADRVAAVDVGHGRAMSLFKFAVLVAFGFGAEWLFRRITRRTRRRLDGLPIDTVNQRLRLVAVRFALALGMGAAFALGSIAPFLTLDWNPVRREMYLGLLIAFVAIRVAADIGDFLLAPDHQRFASFRQIRWLPASGPGDSPCLWAGSRFYG